MKKISFILSALVLGAFVFVACEDEEFGALQDVPPSASAVDPGGIKLGSEAVLQAAGADGVVSPLASGTLTFLDADFVEIASVNASMAGQADTISMDALTSGIASLDTGTYNLIAITVDSKGNTSPPDTTSFTIFDLPFDANYPSMYLLGGFNGWNGSPEERANWRFELVAANTWQLDSVENFTGAFKFSVNSDFGDTDPNNEDWGDPDCSGTMISNKDPDRPDNTNTVCPDVDGTYNITFNDETLNYILEEVITLASNVDELFLLGSFNNFEGNSFDFRLVDDNTWELTNVPLAPNEVFKFGTSPDLMGPIYGAGPDESTAAAFGPNIENDEAGIYTISFNDLTLAYSLTKTGDLVTSNGFFAVNSDMFIVGTFNSFNIGDPTAQMTLVDNFTWERQDVTFVPADRFLFISDGDFDPKWGDGACDGVAELGGNDTECSFDGTLDVTFNDRDLSYSVE